MKRFFSLFVRRKRNVASHSRDESSSNQDGDDDGCWGVPLTQKRKIVAVVTGDVFFGHFYSPQHLPVQKIKNALKRGNIDPNAQDREKGRTALSLACSHKHESSISLVKFLLCEVGAVQSIHTPDARGWTPLHHAAYAGNAEHTDVCLRFGADPNAKDEKGRTPLHLACSSHRNPNHKFAYHWSPDHKFVYPFKQRQIDCMDYLINANPMLLEERDNEGRTPLFECLRGVGKGISWDLTVFMLERGANLTVVDNQHRNLVHHVLEEVSSHLGNGADGMESVPMRVLFDTMVLFRLLINKEPQLLSQRDLGINGGGLTPFQTVCFWGNTDLIFYFLKEHCAIQELLL